MLTLLLACAVAVDTAENECYAACYYMHEECGGEWNVTDPTAECMAECDVAEASRYWSDCVLGVGVAASQDDATCSRALSGCGPAPCFPNGYSTGCLGLAAEQ